MDKINLNIGDYLRFVLAGAWYLMALLLMHTEAFGDFYRNNSGPLIILALIIGALIYSVHRAVIFPLFYKSLLFLFRKSKGVGRDNLVWIPFYPSKLEIELDVKRWKERKDEKSLIRNLVDWSSQIHFLYCTAWAFLLALLSNRYVDDANRKNLNIVWLLFVVILVSGFVSHLRNFVFDIKIRNLESENKKL
jgi:hypothetical protein